MTVRPAPASDAVDDPSAELSAALRGYLDHLAVERGVARNTLLSYHRDLTRYLLFLAAAGRTRVAEITAADAVLRGPGKQVDHPDLGPWTVNRAPGTPSAPLLDGSREL